MNSQDYASWSDSQVDAISYEGDDEMIKVIIAGSRSFNDYSLLCSVMGSFYSDVDVEVVCGGANGADLLGKKWSEEMGSGEVKMFPPDWHTHGKAAGPIRNEQMVKYADAAVIFWDGQSKGTQSLMQLCNKHKIPYVLVTNFT